MSVIHGAAIHFAKRGMDVVRNSEVAQMKLNAAAFTEKDLKDLAPEKFWPVFLTAVVMVVICASINYTVGNVMTTLAMIESPANAAVITLKEDVSPPPYSDEPDAPIEKKDILADSLEESNVEVSFVSQKPITTSVRATHAHLRHVGGFRARWRGLGASIFYFGLHAVARNIFMAVLSGITSNFVVIASLSHLLSSLVVARMHLTWTHAMIVAPSSKAWHQRLPTRKQTRAIFLPALVYSVAQQLIIAVPVALFNILDLGNPVFSHDQDTNGLSPEKFLYIATLFLLPLSALSVAIFFAVPAKATLVRIEASLLPASESTIVHFDRDAIVGDLDTSSCRSHRALFVSAWRSVDKKSVRRVIIMQIKNQIIQFGVLLAFAHVMLAEVFIIGGEKLALLIKAAVAEAQLAIIAHAQSLEPVHGN